MKDGPVSLEEVLQRDVTCHDGMGLDCAWRWALSARGEEGCMRWAWPWDRTGFLAGRSGWGHGETMQAAVAATGSAWVSGDCGGGQGKP